MNKELSQKLREEIKTIAEKYNIKIKFYRGGLTKQSKKEFINKVDWGHISRFVMFSNEFITEFYDNIDWYFISKYKLSESIIRKFHNKVSWIIICYKQKLSEDFLEEFQDKIHWNCISWSQILSENFIRKFSDKLDWCYISEFQKLSIEFILEFHDKIDIDCLLHNRHIDAKTKEKIQLIYRTILT